MTLLSAPASPHARSHLSSPPIHRLPSGGLDGLEWKKALKDHFSLSCQSEKSSKGDNISRDG